MIDLFEVARELQTYCDQQNWRSCFIGGLAVQRWGEPRVTRDVDLALLAGFGNEVPFVDILLAKYQGRVSDSRAFALRNRVVLLRTSTGVGIDISLAALPFEERLIDRSTKFSFGGGIEIRTCSAEDLIVLKLFALRPMDIHDAEGVAIRNKSHLDWEYVQQQLRPLAEVKADPAILENLARLRAL